MLEKNFVIGGENVRFDLNCTLKDLGTIFWVNKNIHDCTRT